MQKCNKFNFTPEQIKELTINEAVYNEAELLVELDEYTIAHSDFSTPIDAIWLSKIVIQYINKKDFCLKTETYKYMGVSPTGTFKAMKGFYLSEKSKMKIVKSISDYGYLDLKK